TRGNMGVIAAGTGLGEAFLGWDGKAYRPFPSEGGHTEFGPRNDTESRLLEYLREQFSHVSYERVVSGPGLLNVYRFFRKTENTPEPGWLTERLKKEDPPTVITETALEGKDEVCGKALDLFISVYGAEAGNLALKVLATGGIYIAGGIAPMIREELADGGVLKAFRDKGRYEALLKDIPVRVVLNKQTPLTGAARYALQQTELSS
ncbi:MAG TPA: glucokinase, partial [Nitrospiria bacterium]